jgi:hypothetical protein
MAFGTILEIEEISTQEALQCDAMKLLQNRVIILLFICRLSHELYSIRSLLLR